MDEFDVDSLLDEEFEETSPKEESSILPEEESSKEADILPEEEDTLPEEESSREADIEEEGSQDTLPEEESSPDNVFLIYGDKGHGKTVQALGFPGNIAVFSFDGKTVRVKKKFYKNSSRIKVYNVIRHIDFSSDVRIKETSLEVYNKLLNTIKSLDDVDAIVFDSAEMLVLMCEWAVRMRSDLETFGGMPFDKWKERKALMINLHNAACEKAKRAVIYTCYPAKDEIVVEGEFVAKIDAPKWIDIVVTFADFVIHAFKDTRTLRYMVKVISSKDVDLIPEKVFDVHNTTIWEVLGWK